MQRDQFECPSHIHPFVVPDWLPDHDTIAVLLHCSSCSCCICLEFRRSRGINKNISRRIGTPHSACRALSSGHQNWITLWGMMITRHSNRTIFHPWKLFSTLVTSHMQHFPFPASSERGTSQWTPNVNDTKEWGIQIEPFKVQATSYSKFQFDPKISLTSINTSVKAMLRHPNCSGFILILPIAATITTMQ